MKTYYKAVCSREGYYVSASTFAPLSVRYEIGKWAKPDIGKLFVFDTLQNAHDMFGCGGVVMLCEAKNISAPSMPLITVVESEYEDYWKGNLSRDGDDWPLGTLVCDAVKILEDTNDNQETDG